MGNRRTSEACLAAACGLFCGLLLLLFFELEVGPRGLLWGALAAVVPVPLYVALALWLDRFESEPPWMLVLAFGWGATVAVFFPYVTTSVLGVVFSLALGPDRAEFVTIPIVAPIVEETSKFIVLLVLYFWKKGEFDGVVDGIVYACMVGLGFAMAENILYYSQAVAQAEWPGLAGTFFMRGVLGPFGHPLYTAMSGIGLGMASRTVRRDRQLARAVLGLALAVLLHFLWNTSVLVSSLMAERSLSTFASLYVLVWVPLFLGFLGLVTYSLYEEGRAVREGLLPELASGDLTAPELDVLSSMVGRFRASARTFWRRGFRAWRLRRRYHHTASELAFYRRRSELGVASDDASEESLSAHFRSLRDRLGAERVRI